MFIVKIIVLLWLSYRSFADCGEPGSAKSTMPDLDYLNASHVYPEGYKVSYECLTTLAGDSERVCENGKWSETIPKCRKFASINWNIMNKIEIRFSLTL